MAEIVPISTGSSGKRPVNPVLRALKKARALVAKGWTQNTFARSKDNVPVSLRDPAACKFCAAGAIRRASESAPVADRAMIVLSGVCAGGIAPAFNDLSTTTKKDVLAAFDRAIAKVRA